MGWGRMKGRRCPEGAVGPYPGLHHAYPWVPSTPPTPPAMSWPCSHCLDLAIPPTPAPHPHPTPLRRKYAAYKELEQRTQRGGKVRQARVCVCRAGASGRVLKRRAWPQSVGMRPALQRESAFSATKRPVHVSVPVIHSRAALSSCGTMISSHRKTHALCGAAGGQACSAPGVREDGGARQGAQTEAGSQGAGGSWAGPGGSRQGVCVEARAEEVESQGAVLWRGFV